MRQRKSEGTNYHEMCYSCPLFKNCSIKNYKADDREKSCGRISIAESLNRSNESLKRSNESLKRSNETFNKSNEILQRSNAKLLEILKRDNTPPIEKTVTLPPIVKDYTYDEFIEYAFSPGTSDKEARKSKTALKRASKLDTGIDIRFFSFSVPVFPTTGPIIIHEPELGNSGSDWNIGRTPISYREFMQTIFDSTASPEVIEYSDALLLEGIKLMKKNGWGWQRFKFWKNNYSGNVSFTYPKC